MAPASVYPVRRLPSHPPPWPMNALPRSPQSDPLEDRFRLDSVPAGAWVSFVLCSAALAYALAFAQEDRRALLVVLILVAGVGGVLTMLLPWERIIRSRWREAAFMSWTLADFVLIAAVAAIDGGGESPLALALFIPVVFTGLSYPRWAVITVGVLAVITYLVLAAASGTDGGYTLMFAGTLTSIALMSSWQARNHESWREALATASRTDALTGALNRRGFEESAAAALAALPREEKPLTLLLLDLDQFKAYNDVHGHAAGDELLREAARAIAGVLRPGDTVARIGGDEFAVLLPGADDEDGRAIAERIDAELGPQVPHSLGVASAGPEGGELDPLYRAADLALYADKHRRRAARSATPGEITA